MPQYKKVFDVGTYAGVSGYTRVGIPTLRTPGSGGKQVAKSLRFRAANSAYLNRTPSAGNRKTWTWSAWIKRGAIGTYQMVFICDNGTTDATFGSINFQNTDTFNFGAYNQPWRTTTQVFKDTSTWYHFVVAFDTTQAAASNRVKVYVNGVQLTSFGASNDPALNTDYGINQAVVHNLGKTYASYGYFDGYMSEVYFIDGSALDPTSFGEYNSDNIWVPKAYSGSFAGTNSFYLDFSDVGTTTAGGANTGYGKDLSGKGTPNNWTTNNFGTTSTLATYDSMYDSPTDYDNSVYGAGNYAVLNPLTQASTAISNGNLAAIASGFSYADCDVTFSPEGLKGYFEFTISSTDARIGFIPKSVAVTGSNYTNSSAFVISPYYNSVDQGNSRFINSYFTGSTANDIIGCAFDFTGSNRNVWWSRNGTWGTTSGGVGNPATGANPALTATNLNAGPYRFYNAPSNATTVNFNFGQRNFNTAPPSGFSALNTKNITRPTDANMWFYGDTPDLMWIKNRSATADHSLTDTVRGVGLGLTLTATATENGAQDVAEMNKFGMTLIGASSRTTAASNSFVYWGWKGGGATTATNTQGSITSQVSANVSTGFSIVSYTGNGSSGATIGHGLGATPGMIFVKNRNSAFYFATYHSSLSAGNQVFLDLDAAQASITTVYSYGGVSSVSSTTFTVIPGITNISNVNASGNAHVAYCFAPIAGYSSFGNYTANANADGPFVYTGFRPRFVLVKNTTRVLNWIIYDTSRDLYNTETQQLYPNTTGNEISGANIDFLSNGFKIRAGSASGINHTSGDTYIYAAFAEVPFKIARAR